MYSPKIQEDLVRAMYWIKQQTGVSITRQANAAIRIYLDGIEQVEQRKQKKEVADGAASDQQA